MFHKFVYTFSGFVFRSDAIVGLGANSSSFNFLTISCWLIPFSLLHCSFGSHSAPFPFCPSHTAELHTLQVVRATASLAESPVYCHRNCLDSDTSTPPPPFPPSHCGRHSRSNPMVFLGCILIGCRRVKTWAIIVQSTARVQETECRVLSVGLRICWWKIAQLT